MNASLKKAFQATAYVTLALIAVPALLLWLYAKSVQHQAASLRQALRQQGYKTDLADFDITNDAPAQAREMELMVFDKRPMMTLNTYPPDITPIEVLDLLPSYTNGAASVLWQEDSPMMLWKYVRKPLTAKRQELDTACEAAISYPIRLTLDASKGSGSFSSSTSSLLDLCSALDVRVLLELHDGHPAEAWTNLLAATRLVTAWEPNGSVACHLFRSDFMAGDFAATWQALQYRDWPDAKLALLQHEWESADFFASVPDTAAFDCAQSLKDGQDWAQQPPYNGLPFRELIGMIIHDPSSGLSEMNGGLGLMWFRKFGVYLDEKKLLLEMTNRESQLHQAIQSPNWAKMKVLPGVSDGEPFQSASSEYYASQNINFHRETAQKVLARIAPAEARRRLLIVAIALERYRGKYGKYPSALAPLAPEFLKTVPVDFMDGKPLRYHLTEDGHFVLYSVGPDGVDNGGRMQSLSSSQLPYGYAEFWYPQTNVDIVWPQPFAFIPGSQGPS